MPRARTWKELLPGLLALSALVGASLAVLIFARVGAMHGRTVQLYAVVSQATGLMKGSEVWLVGQKIGLVHDVEFRSVSTDTVERIVVTLDVLEKDLPFVRRGSNIEVRPGGNMIGAPIVAIAAGTSNQPSVRAGDTLHARVGRQMDRTRADFAAAAQGVPLVLTNIRLLAFQLRSARGTLGAIGIGGGPSMDGITTSASRLLATAKSGHGTLGLALHQGEVRQRAAAAMAGMDSLRAALFDPRAGGSVGRFRRDSTLPAVIATVRTDLAAAASLLGQPVGTAGRLQQDSALVQQVARSRAEVAALAADVKRNPLRYIAF